MKKFTKFLSVLSIGLMCVAFASCKDDEPDKTMSYDSLPKAAQSFISTYFSNARVTTVTWDKTDQTYDVTLSNRFELSFDKAGDWTDVDAPDGYLVPDGIVPAKISNYVYSTYPGEGINEIEKISTGYEVELLSGLGLLFNHDGEVIGLNN